MALKKNVETIYGINVLDAYHRVEGLVFDGKEKIKFRVRASLDGVKPHFSDAEFSCDYDLEGKNPIAQAYEHLKTLSEFADTTDC